MVFSPEPTYQYLRCLPRLYRIATGEDVYGSIAMFWPGMDKQVGFSNDYYSAYPTGIELVKGFSEDGGASFFCCR